MNNENFRLFILRITLFINFEQNKKIELKKIMEWFIPSMHSSSV